MSGRVRIFRMNRRIRRRRRLFRCSWGCIDGYMCLARRIVPWGMCRKSRRIHRRHRLCLYILQHMQAGTSRRHRRYFQHIRRMNRRIRPGRILCRCMPVHMACSWPCIRRAGMWFLYRKFRKHRRIRPGRTVCRCSQVCTVLWCRCRPYDCRTCRMDRCRMRRRIRPNRIVYRYSWECMSQGCRCRLCTDSRQDKIRMNRRIHHRRIVCRYRQGCMWFLCHRKRLSKGLQPK